MNPYASGGCADRISFAEQRNQRREEKLQQDGRYKKPHRFRRIGGAAVIAFSLLF
jgi:hypothetical protein